MVDLTGKVRPDSMGPVCDPHGFSAVKGPVFDPSGSEMGPIFDPNGSPSEMGPVFDPGGFTPR